MRRLVVELDTIDAAIRLFDPTADLDSIKRRLYPPRHEAFRGEMMRHVMGALRLAEQPLSRQDIAAVVMKGRGLNPDDLQVSTIIRERVGACLWKLKARGLARDVKIAGQLKAWIRAE